MGRTCGEPDEIGLIPHGGEIERLGRVRVGLLEEPDDVGKALLTKRSGKRFRVSIFLDFLWRSGTTRPHVRCTPVGRACGEPDEIELTAIGVKLNGSGRVPRGWPP